MLHASFHKKSSFLKRYHARHLRPTGERIHAEDEITSTFLGVLDFMRPADVFLLWQEVFKLAGRPSLLPSGLHQHCHPHSAKVELWPRRKEKGTWIEPDALIEFQWEEGHRRVLLMEFKWEASLSPPDQLQRQWEDFLRPDEQGHAYHLFITKNISDGIAAKNKSDVWTPDGENRLLVLPWELIRNALVHLRLAEEESTALFRFAKYADRFLENIGIGHFGGFQTLRVPDALPSMLSTPLFWRPFNGFLDLPEMSGKLQLLPATLFFTSTCRGHDDPNF